MIPRILFVLHLPPPVHGAAMVGKYIHDSRIINDSYHCEFVNLAMAGNMENIGRFSFSKGISLFKLLWLIKKKMRKMRPLLVYVTPNAGGNAFFKDFIVVQVIKMLGGNVVLHFHNKGVRVNSEKYANDFLYKLFFKHTKIILLSQLLYPDISKYVKEDEVYYCANGIPQIEFKRNKRMQTVHILFLSNLIISKGVLQLLDACKILSEKELDFKCILVGAETGEMTAKRLAYEIHTRGVEERLEYLGKKYGEDKEIVWNDADIFVFPSFYPNECFPLVLLEAMQHGLPCVSTNEGAIPDIVEDGRTGFVVEKNNPKQLAEKIEQLMIDEPLRISMGLQGKRKFQEKYTLEAFEKNMVDIFHQVLNGE